MRVWCAILTAVVWASPLAAVRGDIVVQYTFDPSTPGSQPGNPAPNLVGAGFSATNITVTPGSSGLLSLAAPTSYPTTPVLSLNNFPASGAISEATALGSGAYFSFTVDRTNPSLTYNLDSIAFDAARGGAATPRVLYLYSSVDGFTAGDALLVDPIPTDRGSSTLTPYSVALGSQFEDLSGPVEFRIYGTTPTGPGLHLDFDNFLLQGSLSPPLTPEPGSLALFSVMGLLGGLFWWRRRSWRASA